MADPHDPLLSGNAAAGKHASRVPPAVLRTPGPSILRDGKNELCRQRKTGQEEEPFGQDRAESFLEALMRRNSNGKGGA